MEYQEIKDWLDRLIFVTATAVSYENFNSSIQAILHTGSNIQLYSGIEIVADVMGLQLDTRQRSDGSTEFFFFYAENKFFQLGSSKEREVE